ncbi:hypothetical protein XA68_15995 [Ophiocordyceps unilateralis]|uniref:Uncharacterized protein n=1 Tax=Ophiocordyceps unilateralis TaxID=268505 RepID=A0A2A9PLT6_OPHUN|nr:hypothetical protein XA68_15995 [Ophiocordyceps unilateralis]
MDGPDNHGRQPELTGYLSPPSWPGASREQYPTAHVPPRHGDIRPTSTRRGAASPSIRELLVSGRGERYRPSRHPLNRRRQEFAIHHPADEQFRPGVAGSERIREAFPKATLRGTRPPMDTHRQATRAPLRTNEVAAARAYLHVLQRLGRKVLRAKRA